MKLTKLPLCMAIATMAAWFMPTVLSAQNTKIGWVDMDRAMLQTVEGKKAETAITAKFDELRKRIEGKQQQIIDTQNKLKTQDKLLADSVKAGMTRDVERWQTELTRDQQDAEKELDGLRQDVMRPIAEVAEAIVNAYAAQNGFSLIVDVSNQNNESILYQNPNADITSDISKLIDVEMANAKAQAPPAGPPAAPPATPGKPVPPKPAPRWE